MDKNNGSIKMENSSKDQNDKLNHQLTNIDQLDDLILNLNWSTQQSIIQTLNKFSFFLLSGKPVQSKDKEKMSKEIYKLIFQLSSLNLKSTELIKLNRSGDDEENCNSRKKLKLNENPVNELFFELSSDFRIKIINHLIHNKNIALTYSELITNQEIKKDVVKKNKTLINTLLDLPISEQPDSEDDVNYDQSNSFDINEYLINDLNNHQDESKNDHETPNSSTKNNVSQLISKELNDLAVMKSELTELKSQVNQDFVNLKTELKEMVNEIDINKSRSIFTYELNDVISFFKSRNQICSPFFYCRGVPWSLCLNVQEKFNNNNVSSKYLGLFLRCEGFDFSNWRCTVDCELRLLPNTDIVQNRVVKTFKTTLMKNLNNNATASGFMDFISYERLIDPSNGFLSNNSIKLQVYMKADNFLRF